MKAAVALRWILRESRGAWGRVAYFTACLAVGVTAVVGTAALGESVNAGFRAQSREILGADLSVDARRPLPRELDAVLAAHDGLERTDVLETPSMALAGSDNDGRDDGGRDGGAPAARSRLVQIVSVRGRYPLRGELTTDPPGGLAAHLAPDTVVAARDALDGLGVRTGDEIRIGGASFRVAATVVRAPPQFGFSALAGPRVFLNAEGFARTALTGFGSRARHATLVALPADTDDADLAALEREIRAIPGAAYLDVDTHADALPRGGNTTRRVQGFLGLAALLSVVVGGIGVAQIVAVWVAGRSQAIATMRCLGVRPGEILAVSLGHTLLLALAGSAAGAAAGCAVPAIVRAVAPDAFPGGLPVVFPAAAVLRGLALGAGIALVFSLAPLAAIWRVPPARALRADAAPLPPHRGVAVAAALALGAGVFGAAAAQAGRLDWAASFAGGFAALVGALWVAARAMMFVAARIPRLRLERHLRHAVAALGRPGSGTAAAVVALGLGTMVVTTVALVQARLREGLLSQVPVGAPSLFLVDVQPAQWDGVKSALDAAGATDVASVPVIVARIATIDGRAVEDLAAEAEDAGRARRSLTREQRLTTMAVLPESNRIVAGALWSDPSRAEASVEERFARDLGIGLGSTIGFDVQGVVVDVVVTSVRAVEWQSLSINFFLVIEPGVLDRAPALLLASARVPPGAEGALQDRVAAEWRNVTVFRVGPILEEVTTLLRRVVSGIAALGAFSVASGLLVVAGAAAAAALRRRREVALLKTLGATRGDVMAMLAAEYALVGAAAGLVGSVGALALAAGFLRFVAEMPVELPWIAIPLASAGAAAAAAVCGLAASARALAAKPVESLR